MFVCLERNVTEILFIQDGAFTKHVIFILCRMSVTETCEVDSLTSLVKQHVLKAELSRQQEAELTFTLPFESMETFPGLASVNLLLYHLP